MYAATLSSAFAAASMLAKRRSLRIFFLMYRRVRSDPVSGAYAMLIMPEPLRSSATSPSMASDRVPLASCHVMSSLRAMISRQKATISF